MHHYFGVDLETVWFIITQQLPELHSLLAATPDRKRLED
ncbi:MAG: DUF86 domain-containing protein [Methanoculleus sp.]|nr:DUF86 domain-containing protein [Methanoculleus sp.]MDD2787741.1 DUF86 domain-containing protein [Methanoculleus sp.]MDD3217309.1 DUF86 domain-containing protein [Methanoculleus sp.]HOI59216.1 DUF86 domain-containing protein [Methanoculleus sp.]